MSGEEASRREDLAALQRKLRQAVESEAYEEAARLRDKIRSIDPQAS
jgi:protein-arginine kinase activator protein McsA